VRAFFVVGSLVASSPISRRSYPGDPPQKALLKARDVSGAELDALDFFVPAYLVVPLCDKT
jgi:hypothetical protein